MQELHTPLGLSGWRYVFCSHVTLSVTLINEEKGETMLRGFALWLLGVPMGLIFVLWLFGVLG